MKRTSLKRSAKPLRRTKLARSTKPIGPNRKRRKKKWKDNFGDRSHAIRAMDCLVGNPLLAPEEGQSGCNGDTQAAHAIARGMGGVKGDKRDLVPFCDTHHTESGEFRTSQRAAFEVRYGVNLQVEAARIATELDERGYE